MARLTRAAMIGLCAALGLAAAALLASAVWRLDVDCAHLAGAECALARSLANDGARVEAGAALGCFLAAFGLFWRLRGSDRPPTSAPPRS